MITKEMTVHEALSFLKVADSRIAKELSNATFCAAVKACSKKVDGIPVEEFKSNAMAKYQKVTDLINEVNAIKAAINKSNAETVITVAGKEMSVAEAIYYMNHGTTIKQILIDQMEKQMASSLREVSMKNGRDLDERTDKYMAATFGTKEKVLSDELRKAQEDFRNANTYEVVDPIGINEVVSRLRDEVDEFNSSVDAAIQMSNASTKITVSF